MTTDRAPRALTYPELVEVLHLLGTVASPEAEGFTELDHLLQCAFILSQERPDDEELQVAGLVHDIGHQFGDDASHGVSGAELVRSLLGRRVAVLVEAHVPAKRFLSATDPDYRHRLSAVSTDSLALQGGPLGAAEVAEMAREPHAADAVVLRLADDRAKVAGRSVPALGEWLPVLSRVAGRG